MSHEFMSSHDKSLKSGALIAGAVLVGGGLLDIGHTLREDNDETTGVESHDNPDGPLFVFMRGCGENYQAQAPILSEKLGHHGELKFPYQTRGRHSQEIIDHGVLRALDGQKDRDKVFVSTSMGLMNTLRSFENPEVMDAIGEGHLRALISLSGMTSREDLQPSMRRAAQLSSALMHSAFIGYVWRMQRLEKARRPLAHSDATSSEEARIHHLSSAIMPRRLMRSQHQTIATATPGADGSHAFVVERHPDIQLSYISADFDAVVDTRRAARSMERLFQHPVSVDIDDRRPHGSHADDLEFIEPLDARMAAISRRSRGLGAAAGRLSSFTDLAMA